MLFMVRNALVYWLGKKKIEAHKEGTNWFTTKIAIEYYMTNRKRMR